MQVQPYLVFNGRSEEAIDFYRRVLNAEIVALMRFRDSPEPAPPGMLPPGMEDKVMHAELRIGDSAVMISDGQCRPQEPNSGFQGFSLALNPTDADTAQRLFTALADGGQVQMPLGPTFWSPCFGILVDRFGLGWMVSMVAAAHDAA